MTRHAPAIPRATYRLQLHRDFPFERAVELVPYLSRLGVSHVYVSPILQARPGSLHGYDIVDHDAISAELGGLTGLERLVDGLRSHEMGLVLDIVPNHMAIGSDNARWMSVLEHGPASPFAAFFDIDWHPHKSSLEGRVLLPILEDHYGHVLERGLLRVCFRAESGEFDVTYHDHRFPLDPRTYPLVLSHGLDVVRDRLGNDDSRLHELETLLASFARLAPRDACDVEGARERLRDADVLRRQLARLVSECRPIGEFVHENVGRLQGAPDTPRSPDALAALDALDALLDAQAYRLAFWRTAADEINYRRFFDVNELAGLRQEDPAVFEATHRRIVALVRSGHVAGLRIDHPDGLHDPAAYYERLATALGGSATDGPPIWTVAEKILAPRESLPEDQRVHGTTGYDFCQLVTGLYVDPRGRRALDRTYHRFVGRRVDYHELIYRSKRRILDTALGSELTTLTGELDRISESDRRTRDFTRQRLREALAEVIAAFPVYRTYVTAHSVTPTDRRHVDAAIHAARGRDRAIDTSVYDFIRAVLLLEAEGDGSAEARRAIVRFAQRFQQTTSPVAAKGVEDTAFYLYNRLLALNEVGGEPSRFGVTVAEFHRATVERAARHPHAMLCSSTHDSKRSEDARTRIAVLSEWPGAWEGSVRRFAALNRRHKRRIGRRLAPTADDEYAFYQTLVGLWPAPPPGAEGLASLRERLRGWAVKAVREAKAVSSWIEPNERYERALTDFVDATLDTGNRPFLDELAAFQRALALVAAVHGVAQVLLKLTVPGVPDIYQGHELIETTLVDPDNRRPVDFARRRQLLATLEGAGPTFDPNGRDASVEAWTDGRAKLWATWQALRLRRRMPALFRDGAYRPLDVEGRFADHVVAFVRERDGERLAVVVPRLVGSLDACASGRLPLGEAWGDTRVALSGRWHDALSDGAAAGGPLAVGELFARFPAALLLPC